jgi:RNA polymerase sigma factor (sigma-70 family)
MGKGQHGAGSRHFRTLFTVGAVGGLTDGQLLERFTAQDGEAAELAFAALVERHGAMVLRVCRSVLRDPHEAHDAFQATFLVLVRRAGSLWVRDSLGPWIHQVAYRVASCARSAANRRRKHERRAAEMVGSVLHEEHRDDLGDVLHDEVNRLSGGCRAAVVLCYFEGLSPEQAARQLGCPVGTVQSRLARGRERLRSRLTRRGLAPALGGLGTSVAAEAAPVSLVAATIRAARTPSLAGAVSGSVIQLSQGVLRSMFLIKLKAVAAAVITIAALGAGAGAMLQEAPAPQPKSDPEQVRAEPEAQGVGKTARPEPAPEMGPPPKDLVWTAIPQAEWPRILGQLATQTKDNYEKIKRWRGTYSYIVRENLSDQFVAQFLPGAQPAGKAAPLAKAEPLIQEFDRVLKFAIDLGSDSIYQDVETRRMRFLKIGTDEEVKIPNVGPPDHRWILTPDRYLVFNPKERATSAFLPDHPEARNKRRAERFPTSEARNRAGGGVDPRTYFKFDPMNSFWTSIEQYQRIFRGEFGADPKKLFFEERFKLDQAEGPGGRWYRDRMELGDLGRRPIWMTTLWSPQAGYNPVSRITTLDKPDGTLVSKVEWSWKQIDEVYIPSTIKESYSQVFDGQMTREQVSKLTESTLNRPLGLHQFDEQAFGMADGDLILDHPEKVVYIIKGGEPVKLANFGEDSILKPGPPKPSPTAATAKKPSPKSAGRIYTSASLGTNNAGLPVASLVAIDPETGEVTNVFDGYALRLRISPDRQRAAFVSGSLRIRALADDAQPERVIPMEGAANGGLASWSADGKKLIVSVATHDETLKQWVNGTFRINVDGSDKERLKIPTEDTVQDWSANGEWVLTASLRNAKIGWQLYIMRPDGTDQRQITEGGNPFYARFSPDGRRLLYSDGPRQGIWIVDFDGKNRRRILETGKGMASACWSPDGKRIAVAIEGSEPQEHGRFEIVNVADGTHRTLLTMPGRNVADMPDWR